MLVAFASLFSSSTKVAAPKASLLFACFSPGLCLFAQDSPLFLNTQRHPSSSSLPSATALSRTEGLAHRRHTQTPAAPLLTPPPAPTALSLEAKSRQARSSVPRIPRPGPGPASSRLIPLHTRRTNTTSYQSTVESRQTGLSVRAQASSSVRHRRRRRLLKRSLHFALLVLPLELSPHAVSSATPLPLPLAPLSIRPLISLIRYPPIPPPPPLPDFRQPCHHSPPPQWT